MGSKKHKKHHKSDKKESSSDDRQEKPLKLVLKVGSGSVQSPVHASNSNSSSSHAPKVPSETKPVFEEPKPPEKPSSSHSHEKHKKSKKKKKKKSNEKDKDRHERKRKHHHHHHHHREHSHERKEKRRKVDPESSRLTEPHDSRDSLPVRPAVEPQSFLPVERPVRDPRTCTLKKKAPKTPLQILLYYLLKKLQMKDPQGYFAWPVTDVIAPGYSSIIAYPIDFSNISRKIDDKDYPSVPDFKLDIKLMCDNAMTYNRPDTVYYKAAKKLWHATQKLMNKDQLLFLKKTFPYMQGLSVDELGFDINDDNEESLPASEPVPEPASLALPEAKKSKVPPCWSTVEDIDDDEDPTPEEILHQAQRAAKAAANRLTMKRPNSKFGFLRQDENGSTTLAIIHPRTGDQEIKVTLDMLATKLTQGTGTIYGYKEDSKNIIKPVQYNNYGSYSSYAPQYDSTFSNLSKDDSDLVLSTYGDELGLQYAESLTSFARDNDYLMRMVDEILDNLTGGDHSKTVKILEERRLIREEEALVRRALKPLNDNDRNRLSPLPSTVDLDQALEDIHAELSRLESSDVDNKKLENGDKASLEQRKQLLNQRKAIQVKLDNTTALLEELKKVQSDRLGANPPPHLSLVRGPGPLEQDLAERVTKKLIDLSSQLPPEAIVNIRGLRKAMGITYNPTSSKNASQAEDELDQSDNPMIIDESTSPESSSESRIKRPNINTDFRNFLEAGQSIKMCPSPMDT